MKVREIQAKGILNTVKQPDEWFGLKYNMNLYRGCQHQCTYCDSRSECYQIEDFNHEVLVKTNAIELLECELPRKRVKGTIGTGSMNDPYMPLELKYNLTGRALGVIARHRYPVHIITKSDLVLRDLETITEISQVYAAVSLTITTADDALSKKLEPGAPSSSRRFDAIKALAKRGVHTGVLLMPVLPFIEDSEENIRQVVQRAHDSGAEYILHSFGMTLRDRQREYFYQKLDAHFPGLRGKYESRYGNRYGVRVPHAARLEKLFFELSQQYGIDTSMPKYGDDDLKSTQLELL